MREAGTFASCQLCDRSGKVRSDDPLVVFLYELMRDYVTPGVIETLVADANLDGGGEYLFTNGWLANYATDVAKRLKSG